MFNCAPRRMRDSTISFLFLIEAKCRGVLWYNQIWVIEINPRMSGSIEFSILAGFNPFLYYQKNFKLTKSDYKIKYNKIYKRFFSVAQDA